MPSPVVAALTELSAVRPAYEQARQFYDGEVAEVIAAPKLRDLLAGTGTTYCVNYARTPVDVLVERTTIQGWTVKDAVNATLINQAWEDSDLGLEAKDVHRRAYEYGDSYLIGWRDEEADSGVSFYAHDPTDVRVFYRADRPRQKSHAVHQWVEPGDPDPDTGNGLGEGLWLRVDVYYPDHLERYVSRDIVGRPNGDPTGFVPQLDDDFRDFDADGDEALIFYADEGLPDVIPVFHFRTARPYGRPEHADAYGPQRGINKLVTSMMGSVDFHILPQRWATTESALKGEGAPDLSGLADAFADLDTDQTAVTPETFDGDDDLDSTPGGVWLMSGKNMHVGEFAAALMDNFLKPKNDLVDSMAAVTDLPVDRFRPASGQQPSGESRRMSEIPLNKKTSDRFAQFGVTWREWASWVVAASSGASEVDKVDANVAWAPPENYSDAASWTTALAQLEAGVPYEQVLVERGYSLELAAKWARDREAKASQQGESVDDSAEDDVSST